MVLKKNRKGLNTGNTIRFQRLHGLIKAELRHGLISSEEMYTKDDFRKKTKDISLKPTCLKPKHPTTSVFYSLNKKGRWNLPDAIKESIQNNMDDPDVQIELMEHSSYGTHHAGVSLKQEIDYPCHCTAYYSNIGAVKEKVSRTEMSHRCATQGHDEFYHRSKQERRLARKRALDGHSENPQSIERRNSYYKCYIMTGEKLNSKVHNKLVKRDEISFNWRGRPQAKLRTRERVICDGMQDYQYLDDYTHVEGASYSESTTSTSYKASLVDFAVSQRCKREKMRRARKSLARVSVDGKKNSKLIHVDEPSVYITHEGLTEETNTNKSVSEHSSYQATKTTPLNPKTPTYTEVTITGNTSPAYLQQTYKHNYSESFCAPRKFSLDLSEKVSSKRLAWSFRVVFVMAEERLYDYQNEQLCRLHFIGDNSESFKINGLKSGEAYTVDGIFKRAASSYKTQNRNTQSPKTTLSVRKASTQIHTLKDWKVKPATVEELSPQVVKHLQKKTTVNLLNHAESEKEIVIIHNYFRRSMSYATHCSICYDQLDPGTSHSALLPCVHVFCDECWNYHLTSSVYSGNTNITCPEYKCTSQVDPVFMSALVHNDVYNLHVSHLVERYLFSQGIANWCPSEKCEKLFYNADEQKTEEPIPITCFCGANCCFQCRKEPHWPLACDQLTKYHNSLLKHGLLEVNLFETESEVTINTKPCPSCQMPIEKDGGCVHMHCSKCQTAFCWKCGQPYTGSQYYHECTAKEMNYTTNTFSFGLPDSRNSMYNYACRHRVLRSQPKIRRLKREIKTILSKTSLTQGMEFMLRHKHLSLPQYLNQLVSFLAETHRLLEFCFAANAFRKGPNVNRLQLEKLVFLVKTIESKFFARFSAARISEIERLYDMSQKTITDLMKNANKNSLRHH